MATLTHTIRIPDERLGDWDGGHRPVGIVTGWLWARRERTEHTYRTWSELAPRCGVHQTDDPEYAAVLTAVAAEGWQAAERLTRMLDERAPPA